MSARPVEAKQHASQIEGGVTLAVEQDLKQLGFERSQGGFASTTNSPLTTRLGFSYALPLVEGINAQALFAERADDTDAIIQQATEQEMEVVIPPKNNRKHKRQYDRELYKLRHQ